MLPLRPAPALTAQVVTPEVAVSLIGTAARIVLILAAALVAKRLSARLVRRLVDRIEREGEKRSADPDRVSLRATTLGGVLGSVATAVVFTLATLLVLGEVGVNLGPLIAGAGIVGLALGFGAQQLVQDFLSGIFMLAEDAYGVGDIVDTGEAVGTIEGIGLRTTRLRDVEGTLWHIPNGDIRRLGNYTREWARAILDVGVPYDVDVARASAVLAEAARALAADEGFREHIKGEPEVWGVQDLGADEVSIRVVCITEPAKQWAVARELRARVKAALEQADIEIPFPQRTVWLRPEAPAPHEHGTVWEPASPPPGLVGAGTGS